MPRWPEDTRERLVDAAIALFTEHGYPATTIDQIADRAGVSARTFFRHFGDKEEVLFADDDALLPLLLTTIATADSDNLRDAETLMHHALGSLADAMEPGRATLAARQRIVDSDVALSGRELAKQARWQSAVADALIDRGFHTDDADVLAAIGFALFRRALHAWLAREQGTLRAHIEEALPRIRTVLDAQPRSSRHTA
ncbi:TetR/AcrR family transcriptional regulator [Microcella sp.]|uniref:TetR/AcrR family transcriptional regulator n=1 Tax=Microcella sp. TaxID=1913979 RepID=UPI00391C3FC1